MNIVGQFLWWDTPNRHAQKVTPKNWARSAEVQTTWDLWDIVRGHPRYQEWALPDTLSGGIPPTDRQTYKKTYQNWARSAEIRTTWNLWDIVQHHPRYQEWALPDNLSGCVPLTDTPKRLVHKGDLAANVVWRTTSPIICFPAMLMWTSKTSWKQLILAYLIFLIMCHGVKTRIMIVNKYYICLCAVWFRHYWCHIYDLCLVNKLDNFCNKS